VRGRFELSQNAPYFGNFVPHFTLRRFCTNRELRTAESQFREVQSHRATRASTAGLNEYPRRRCAAEMRTKPATAELEALGRRPPCATSPACTLVRRMTRTPQQFISCNPQDGEQRHPMVAIQ
jgi:hypothetical protein